MQRGLIPTVIGASLLMLGLTGTLTALVFLILGGVFGVVFPAVFGTPFADLQLDRRAAACGGTVEAVEPNPGLTVNNQSTVRLVYRYDDGTAERRGEIVVTANDPLAALPVGEAVIVEYLPEDPAVSRVQGGKVAVAGWAGAMGLGFGAFGVLITAATLSTAAVGLIVLLWGVRRLRAARRW